jgi:hypothetical protein
MCSPALDDQLGEHVAAAALQGSQSLQDPARTGFLAKLNAPGFSMDSARVHIYQAARVHVYQAAMPSNLSKALCAVCWLVFLCVYTGPSESVYVWLRFIMPAIYTRLYASIKSLLFRTNGSVLALWTVMVSLGLLGCGCVMAPNMLEVLRFRLGGIQQCVLPVALVPGYLITSLTFCTYCMAGGAGGDAATPSTTQFCCTCCSMPHCFLAALHSTCLPAFACVYSGKAQRRTTRRMSRYIAMLGAL